MIQNTQNDMPFVSVIMPVYNEEDFIERSLASVLKQNYPLTKLEIIVADGMSSDSTRKIIENISSNSLVPIKVIDNPKRIAPSGLNKAISASQGSIIVRIDGHCEVDSDYVSNCVEYLKAGLADGVGGPIETIGDNLQAKAIACAMSSKFGVGGSAFRTINDREMYVDTVAFPGYKKSTLQITGGFNEELIRNQDDEYNYRIRKNGGKILLSPKIRSKYYSRSTFKSLWRQYYQYGYWKVRVFQIHPKQMSVRQFIPFLFVIGLIGFIILSLFSKIGRWGLFFYLTTYFTASLIAALRETRRIEYKGIPYVLLSYWILHLSYGLGFFKGLLDFRQRWNDK